MNHPITERHQMRLGVWVYGVKQPTAPSADIDIDIGQDSNASYPSVVCGAGSATSSARRRLYPSTPIAVQVCARECRLALALAVATLAANNHAQRRLTKGRVEFLQALLSMRYEQHESHTGTA
jgi:hypothetical protein